MSVEDYLDGNVGKKQEKDGSTKNTLANVEAPIKREFAPQSKISILTARETDHKTTTKESIREVRVDDEDSINDNDSIQIQNKRALETNRSDTRFKNDNVLQKFNPQMTRSSNIIKRDIQIYDKTDRNSIPTDFTPRNTKGKFYFLS